jgi:Flp pilus assembly protein TadD
MRQKLGESLTNVEVKNFAYQQPISTSSLEALEAVRLADQQIAMGSDANGLTHLLRATEIDPSFALAFSVAAVLYVNLGQTDKAREYDGKASALLDRVHSEHERLFITYEHFYVTGDVKKTTEAAELAVRTFPRDPIFHGNLAVQYRHVGQFEKAAWEAEAEIREAPQRLQGYGNAFYSYLWLNRPKDLQRIVDEALARLPDSEDVHVLHLQIAYPEGDLKIQDEELKWLSARSAQSAYAIRLRNANALALGQPRKAREFYPSNLTADGERNLTDFVTNFKSGSFPPPTGAAPANPTAQFLYPTGQALLKQGKPAEAATEFQKILSNRFLNWGPFYPLAQVGLARSEAKLGHPAQAKKAYEDFFALWKDAEPDLPILIEARKEYAALK